VVSFIPIRQQGMDVALSGFLDMPARIGKTEHDWADEDGVEPYVAANEIFFGGRELKLLGVITGTDAYDCNAKMNTLYSLIDSFTTLVPLITDYGTYQVYVNAPVVGEYLAAEGLRVTITMREPNPSVAGTIPVATSSEFGIDGISFADLGGAYITLGGDRWNRTAPKKIDVTAYGKEAWAITKKEASVLELRLAIKTDTYSQMKAKLQGLMALFASPGLRTLTVNNDKLRSFYVKDGFTTSMIHVYGDFCACVIDVKLTESGSAMSFTELVDSLGNIITDNNGNTIMVRL
jgi:hypothetical protein